MGISNPSDKGTQVSVVLVIGVVSVTVRFHISPVNENTMVSNGRGWFIDTFVTDLDSDVCLLVKVSIQVLIGIDPDLNHNIFVDMCLVVSKEAVVPLVFVGFVVVSVTQKSSVSTVSLFGLIGTEVNLTLRSTFASVGVRTTVVRADDLASFVAGFNLLDSV